MEDLQERCGGTSRRIGAQGEDAPGIAGGVQGEEHRTNLGDYETKKRLLMNHLLHIHKLMDGLQIHVSSQVSVLFIFSVV